MSSGLGQVPNTILYVILLKMGGNSFLAHHDEVGRGAYTNLDEVFV